MPLKDVIAVNLRTLRDLRGLSQLELAERVGVSRRTIARLEAAEVADPGVDQVRSLAQALGVTVELLIGARLVAARIPVPVEVRAALEGPDGVSVLTRMIRGANEK